MTLAEALATLHAKGRIRTTWMPGMRFTFDDSAVKNWEYRVISSGRIHVVAFEEDCLSLDRWRLTPEGWRSEEYDARDGWDSGTVRDDALTVARLDLDDHATVGCLLALLREARYDDAAYVDRHTDGSRVWWTAASFDDDRYQGPAADSEGEALAAALVAIAEVA